MKTVILFLLCVMLTVICPGQNQRKGASKGTQTPAAFTADEISGMYTFLQEGEFVQITVEDKSKVTGFISRYGDLESDRGAFLDQFFKSGTLAGDRIAFATEAVHGVWYDFQGMVQRGEGKTPDEEAYYVLRGTLTRNATDAAHKASASERDVVFKSFPRDISDARSKRD